MCGVQSSTPRMAFAMVSGSGARGGFEQRSYGNRGRTGLFNMCEDCQVCLCSHCNFRRNVISYAMAATVMPGSGKFAIILFLGGLIGEAADNIRVGRSRCVRHRRKQKRKNHRKAYKEAVHGHPHKAICDPMQDFLKKHKYAY